MQNLDVRGVAHSIVVDESQLGSRAVYIRVYDSQNHQLAAVNVATDRSTADVVVVKPAAAPPPPPPPPVLHTLVLGLAEDAYQGDAQYSVAVDGSIITASAACTVLKSSGMSQEVTVPLASGAHTVKVTFLNDAYGGSQQTDRNLYVNYAKYDGVVIAGASAILPRSGDAFTVAVPPVAASPPPAPTLMVSLNPPATQVTANSPKGTVLGKVSVQYSDGTAFPSTGTISSSDPTFAVMSGLNVVLARNLTPSDEGVHNLLITANDGLGAAASMRVFGGADA